MDDQKRFGRRRRVTRAYERDENREIRDLWGPLKRVAIKVLMLGIGSRRDSNGG